VDELRLPAGTVTGVGSLPHTDPAEAAAYVLQHTPELPAIPSLPRRSPHETMLGQAVVGVRGVRITSDGGLDVDPRRMDATAKITPDLDHEAFAGMRAFLQVARGRTSPVKWQFTGPVTLGLALTRNGVPASLAFDVAIRAVRVHLRAVHKAVSEAMPFAHQVVVLDEPGMTAVLCPGFPVPPDSAIDLVSGALAAVEQTATAGVHCCGDGDWAALLATGPGLASMPVSSDLVAVAGYLAAFLERGGLVAWGVIPTDRPVGTNADRHWRELTDLWCQLVAAGCDPVRLRRQSLVTPACGLGLHDLSQADRVLRLAADVGARIASQASATRLVLGA
jgi:hypothetical protein